MRFGAWHRLLPVVVILTGLMGTEPASAQQRPPGSSPLGEAKPDGSAPSDAWEWLIYVPYRDLKDALNKHQSTVFLPFTEYLKLWERGATTGASDKPPVSAVIAESRYSARIEKDLARIEATFIVQALGKNWSEVPLRFGDAAIGKLTVSEGILLRSTGKGTYSLLLPKSGKHEVKLDLLAHVRTSPEGRSLEFECPPVGITTFDLLIPEADQSVEMTPRLVSLPAEAATGQTHIKANLGSTEKIAAHWHPRVGTKPEMELLAAVSNMLSVSIDERIVHLDAFLKYQILRGELSQIQLAVPVGHRILEVSAGDVRLKGWKAAADANRQLVTVDLLSPMRGNITLEVHTEGPLPAEAFDFAGVSNQGVVHGVHAVGVVRENGRLAVSAVRGITLNVEQQQGLSRIEATEIDAAYRKPDALFYRYYSPSFGLKGTARPDEPRIVLDQNTQLVFGEDELRMTSSLSYHIERAGVFDLVLKVPDNLTIDSVTADSLKGHQFDSQTKLLKISFEQKVEGEIDVHVTAHRDLKDGGSQEQKLPLFEPTGIARETGALQVFGPEGVELITDQEKVIGAHPETEPVAEELSGVRLVSAWSYSRRPVDIPVRVVRKPTRLTAQIASTINISQEIAEVVTLLTYQVEHAGLDTFRFSVPESVADRVQVRSEGEGPNATIKQQARDPQAVDGWVGWTVVMQQKAVGQRRLRISYDLKPIRAEAAAGARVDSSTAPATIGFEPVRALGLKDAQGAESVALSQIEGELAVVKDRTLSVSAEVSGSDLEPIDVRELKIHSAAGANLAYRYFKQPVGLKITAVKHDVQGVVQTVISKALVEIVVGRDPQSPLATYRCRYRIRSSERQRLQLDLPSDSQPLGVSIDGRQIALEKNEAAQSESGWDAYFVNIARAASSDAPFLLTLQLQRPISPAPFQTQGGRLRLALPRVGGKDATGVALQQMRIVTWVPEKYSLVGTPQEFQRETRSYLSGLGLGLLKTDTNTQEAESWLGVTASGLVDFPTEGHAYRYSRLGRIDSIEVTWWHMPFRATVISLAILAIALVLLKTTWEHRLGLVLVAGLFVALYALSDSDAALHFLAAARYGLAAMFMIWVIHGLLGARGLAHAAATATGSSPTIVSQSSTPAANVSPPPDIPSSTPSDDASRNSDRQES